MRVQKRPTERPEAEGRASSSVHGRSLKSAEQQRRSSHLATDSQLASKRRRHERLALNDHALDLFTHFSLRHQDTLARLVRACLERVRKRIAQASHTPARYGHATSHFESKSP
jgi:hypothetical protein